MDEDLNDIDDPCEDGKEFCLLSYSRDTFAWQCTSCGKLFSVANGFDGAGDIQYMHDQPRGMM